MPERTKLAEWLFQHNMKQNALAKQLGVTPATVSQAAKHGKVSAAMWILFAEDYGKIEALALFGPLQVGRNKPPAETT